MKNIVIIIAMMAAFGAKAQNIVADRATGSSTAACVPVSLGYLKGAPSIERVRVQYSVSDGLTYGYFSYWLEYPTVVDSNTTTWTPVVTGSWQLPLNPNLTVAQINEYSYSYVADSLKYNIQYR